LAAFFFAVFLAAFFFVAMVSSPPSRDHLVGRSSLVHIAEYKEALGGVKRVFRLARFAGAKRVVVSAVESSTAPS
jgi:hypothetical protein